MDKYKVIKPLIVLHAAKFVSEHEGIKLPLIKGLRDISKRELSIFNLVGVESNEYSEFGFHFAKELVEYLFDL